MFVKRKFLWKTALVAVIMAMLAGCNPVGNEPGTDGGGSDEPSPGTTPGGGGNPGISRNSARAVTVGHLSNYTISLNGEHWFRFEGTGFPVIFETRGNVVDTYIETYEGNSTFSSSIQGHADDNSGEGFNALVSRSSTLLDTTYFIKITQRSQTSGTYTFVVTQPTANIRTNPIPIEEGYSDAHVINSSGTHWFRFIGTGNSVIFETEENVVNTDIKLFIGDATSEILRDNKQIAFNTIAGTVYYVSINGSSGGNAGTYNFSVREGIGNGSSRTFAIPVMLGYTSSHTIGLSGSHWFQFTGTGSPVIFETLGNVVDTYIETYEGNSTFSSSIQGHADDNSGEGFNALVNRSTTMGTPYFIRVTQRSQTSGTYTFIVR